ncbi:MAG: Arc family DNA binding domain-containing protein [Chloroflexi bacterium]|nr:Arc family DNA binding domain-containing protein [Chloroflexota bacterium]
MSHRTKAADKRRVVLRLEPDLVEAIEKLAVEELRSANGQLEFIVRQALNDPGRLPRADERPGGARRR